MCLDGMERIGKIRGKMRHRQRIRPGDWVLVSLRDFQDKKCDIIFNNFVQLPQTPNFIFRIFQ